MKFIELVVSLGFAFFPDMGAQGWGWGRNVTYHSVRAFRLLSF